MINKTLFSIFKQGSRTYFYSSLFFPSYLKKDVFSLYGFVRKADNLVDSIPQDIKGFYDFKEKYYSAIDGKKTNDIVINSFIELAVRKNFDSKWTDAFLNSMEKDITKSNYGSIEDTIAYMYGSAEVIGLYMAKIMNLPDEALYHAKHLGRSMQYINFIRDIAEDLTLNRVYMPEDEMKKFGIMKLDHEYVKKIPEKFISFIHNQLNYYCKWQKIAEEGYKYIPKRYLIPIKTASEMYNWTASQIYKDPFVIYCRKLKPRIKQIFTTTLLNMIDPKKLNYKLDIYNLQKTYPKIIYNYK
jgi:15-cis-phytoene synthase